MKTDLTLIAQKFTSINPKLMGQMNLNLVSRAKIIRKIDLWNKTISIRIQNF